MDYKVDGADHFCGMCGCWIGNHDSGVTPYGAASYYQIIRTKYCKVCKKTVLKNQKAYSRHNNNKSRKMLCDELIEQAFLPKEENKKLRELIIKLQD